MFDRKSNHVDTHRRWAGRASLIRAVLGTTLLIGIVGLPILSSDAAGAATQATSPSTLAVPLIRDAAVPPALAATTLTSPYGGGYLTEQSNITSVSSTFTVPKIECGGFDSDVAPGVLVINKSDDELGGFVDVGCQNGVEEDFIEAYLNTTYTSWSETSLDGNAFHVSLTESKSKATVTITDVTRHITKSATTAGKTMTEAQFQDGIGLNPTTHKPFPVPVFSTNKFVAAQVNNKPIGSLHNDRFDFEYDSHIYIVPGPLTANENFQETWQNG